MNVGLNRAVKFLKIMQRANIPAILFGVPGIGKTSVVYQMFDEMLDTANVSKTLRGREQPRTAFGLWTLSAPTTTVEEVIGLPNKTPDGALEYLRCHAFLPPPDHTGGGIWLIDEPNRAFPEVEKALLQLLLERQYLDYKLPDGIWIVMTCNPPGGRYQVREMDPAVINRCGVLNVRSDVEEWAKWAASRKVPANMIRFARDTDKYLNAAEDEPDLEEITNEYTSRSLMNCIRAFGVMSPAEVTTSGLYVAHSFLGPEVATAFVKAYKAGDSDAMRAADILSNYDALRPQILDSMKQGNVPLETYAVVLDQIGAWVDKKVKAIKKRGGSMTKDVFSTDEKKELTNLRAFLNDVPGDLARSFIDKSLLNSYYTLYPSWVVDPASSAMDFFPSAYAAALSKM